MWTVILDYNVDIISIRNVLLNGYKEMLLVRCVENECDPFNLEFY